MIPNMYKIAGELLAVRIPRFGTHTGFSRIVYLRRPPGRNVLPSDWFRYACAKVLYRKLWTWPASLTLATIKSRVPFVNFFDGFRTSHEIQKIEMLDNEDLAPLVSTVKALAEFREPCAESEQTGGSRYG